MAGDKLWPYNMYRYNAETGAYERTAAVDGWDKSLSDSGGACFHPAARQERPQGRCQ